jgi:hypothetical protein
VKGVQGAENPELVTHGFTLRGAQLTWAILNGNKQVENRHFSMKPGWYALHTGANTSSLPSHESLLASVEGMPGEEELPHSAIVGAVRISHTLTLEQCGSKEPWAFGPRVNVFDMVCKLAHPVPHKGKLSMWAIEPDKLDAVREQLRHAEVRRNDISHLCGAGKPEQRAGSCGARRPSVGDVVDQLPPTSYVHELSSADGESDGSAWSRPSTIY